MAPEITAVERIDFEVDLPDVGRASDVDPLVVPVYDPGNVRTTTATALRIHTDAGVTGEYVAESDVAFLEYLVGENPLDREYLWDTMRHRLLRADRRAYGPVDVALWDLAGKHYDAPVHELLGTYRRRVPAYATTYVGDDAGGLDSPAAYADFAETVRDRGYAGYKMHLWPVERGEVDRHVETVRAVRERVGDDLDLMLDGACFYKTFADALEVGRACDEHGYRWFEDPYRDTGVSHHGHRRLQDRLETPLLQGAFQRGGPQAAADAVAGGATDLVHADVDYDGGITGAMKIARVAEGLGVDVELNSNGPARRHCAAALRNTNYYEQALVHPDVDWTHAPLYRGEFADGFEAVADDGTVDVPEGPGLGVEYDWEFVEANAVARETHD